MGCEMCELLPGDGGLKLWVNSNQDQRNGGIQEWNANIKSQNSMHLYMAR
jgi:hypothetical protein